MKNSKYFSLKLYWVDNAGEIEKFWILNKDVVARMITKN